MTFEEFQATRRRSDDIGCDLADEHWIDEPPRAHAWA
jgi:hypothetical protein